MSWQLLCCVAQKQPLEWLQHQIVDRLKRHSLDNTEIDLLQSYSQRVVRSIRFQRSRLVLRNDREMRPDISDLQAPAWQYLAHVNPETSRQLRVQFESLL